MPVDEKGKKRESNEEKGFFQRLFDSPKPKKKKKKSLATMMAKGFSAPKLPED